MTPNYLVSFSSAGVSSTEASSAGVSSSVAASVASSAAALLKVIYTIFSGSVV